MERQTQGGVERRAAEFFAGMGLVRRALEGKGRPPGRGLGGAMWRTVFANDFDPMKRTLYAASFDDAAGVFSGEDIREIDPEALPPAELWTASFPCTDLSVAGRGAGIHAGQSGAVWGLLKLLKATPASRKPTHLLFENVIGLLSSAGGADLAALVSAVNDADYGIDPLCVNASHFTPQSRPRLFLIATRQDVARGASVDPERVAVTDARPARLVNAMRALPHAVWHARETGPLPTRRIGLEDVLEPLDVDDPRWWPRRRAEYFFNQVHPSHARSAREQVLALRATRVPAFRRVRTVATEGGSPAKRSVIELRRDGLAGCLRTPKGGSAKQMIFEAGAGEYRVRFLTALEGARLQGVESAPKGEFGENELLFGLGDAVCVPAVRWVLDVLASESPLDGGALRRGALVTTPS